MSGRATYHHGDLRAALVHAAVAAAREGGEDAVRLTALAAQVGVSAAAAYRHFPDGLAGLLGAVGEVANAELADRIRAGTSATPVTNDPVVDARRRFRASGHAYVDYVTAHPGLFQVACRHAVAPSDSATHPHALLEQCLDDLVAVGALPADRRPFAPAAAWAAVHGLSVLLTEGSLRHLPAADRARVVDRTLDMVGRGL
jgi:AcrR family transcriptional regulator